MSSEHVEVLRHMKETIKAIMPSEVAALDAAIASLSAPQPPAEAHCATCSCVPGMTPAVRFDTTPAEKEGAVRDHLIRMGWTPPAEAQAAPPSAPVGVAEAWEIEPVEDDADTLVINTPDGKAWIAQRGDRVFELAQALALAQQPAAVDGDSPYPAPRNRQEAAALAKLALAHLGVTSAHIDAVVARCETDLAAQQGGES